MTHGTNKNVGERDHSFDAFMFLLKFRRPANSSTGAVGIIRLTEGIGSA